MTESRVDDVRNNFKSFKSLKDVGDDNWALFYTFSSKVSEKPGFRNNYFFFQIRSTTLKEGASTIQSI